MKKEKLKKLWIWQYEDWPNFVVDTSKIDEIEEDFKKNVFITYGSFDHLKQEERDELKIHIICNEAYKTSEIEGNILDRHSLQISVKRLFGIEAIKHFNPEENGISEMMVDLHKNACSPLSKDVLCNWHRMIMNCRRDISDKGSYRKHKEPMQIVSGVAYEPTVHYEAPPSERVESEMEKFINWFNGKNYPHTPVLKASLAHLYFELIHPFEDGNGRIGRALVEKYLSINFEHPILLSLSSIIQEEKKIYYENLQKYSTTLEITPWIEYFSKVIIKAQELAFEEVKFLIKKSHFLQKHASFMNKRQEKVILRIFREGVKGFKGGLSAENYQKITQSSSSSATRDLQDMVLKNILIKTGERKHTRYWLCLDKH